VIGLSGKLDRKGRTAALILSQMSYTCHVKQLLLMKTFWKTSARRYSIFYCTLVKWNWWTDQKKNENLKIGRIRMTDRIKIKVYQTYEHTEVVCQQCLALVREIWSTYNLDNKMRNLPKNATSLTKWTLT